MTQEAGKRLTASEMLEKHDVAIDRWPDTKLLIEKAMEEYAQQREQPWVRVSDRLPTEDDSYDDYNEVLTIQIGRQRPTMMKYWEIKHCPFTTHWMKLPPAPHKQ